LQATTTKFLSSRFFRHNNWLSASLTVRSSILSLLRFEESHNLELVELVSESLSDHELFLDKTISLYAKCQQHIYLLMGITHLILSPGNLVNLVSLTDNIYHESWNWPFFPYFVSYLHGVSFLLRRDFRRAVPELRKALDLMEPIYCSLKANCNLTYILACLHRTEDIPEGLESDVLVINEAIALHRLRDWKMLKNISTLRMAFETVGLGDLAAEVPPIIIKRTMIAYLRPYCRVAIRDLAGIFALTEDETRKLVIELIRKKTVEMLVDSAQGMLVKIDITRDEGDQRGLISSICDSLRHS
jgi:hypothetical protein